MWSPKIWIVPDVIERTRDRQTLPRSDQLMNGQVSKGHRVGLSRMGRPAALSQLHVSIECGTKPPDEFVFGG